MLPKNKARRHDVYFLGTALLYGALSYISPSPTPATSQESINAKQEETRRLFHKATQYADVNGDGILQSHEFSALMYKLGLEVPKTEISYLTCCTLVGTIIQTRTNGLTYIVLGHDTLKKHFGNN